MLAVALNNRQHIGLALHSPHVPVQLSQHSREAWAQEAQARLRDIARRKERLKKRNAQISDERSQLTLTDLTVHPALCQEWRDGQAAAVQKLRDRLQHEQLVGPCLLQNRLSPCCGRGTGTFAMNAAGRTV
jgi:hypothetical protein